MSFTHLHLHSEMSLLDGAIKIPDLCKRAAEIGQTAVAITDHGWIAGAVKFQEAAQKAGIKSIIGCETYVATSETIETPAKSGGDTYHLTLLAANVEGYRNLSRLTSLAHLRGLSYKPRIDLQLLSQHSEGLVVLSGCIGAQIPQLIIAGDSDGAEKLAAWYQRVFGERFFIEVMHHGAHGGVDHVRIENDGIVEFTESDLNLALRMLADKLGIGMVATNDAHYLHQHNGDAHDSLLCIGMGAWKEKEGRMRFPGAAHKSWEFYVKSEAEMQAVLPAAWWQTACANTQIVADMIEPNVVPLNEGIMPKFVVPDDDLGYRVWKQTGEFI